MARVEVNLTVNAPQQVVFDTATDHEAYPYFTLMKWCELEVEGSPNRNGMGAIRKGGAGPVTVREEVVAFDPPNSFSYTLLSGAPIKDHLGTIAFADNGDGTTAMTYVVEGRSPIPFTDVIAKLLLNKVIGDLAKGIKKEAEKRAS